MMERMMLSRRSARFPADPLAYMTDVPGAARSRPAWLAPGDSRASGWGEEFARPAASDLQEKTHGVRRSRLDFQTICYKLSAAMIEQKPEDPPAFALDFLRKLKEENAEAAAP
jgi:hypothetical protein